MPRQLVTVDHAKGCVVVSLRGSSCLRDALMDLDCKQEKVNFCGRDGIAHGGMLRAAQKLEAPLADAVEIALAKLVGPRRVLVVGHSLGAGVGALLTALWHEGAKRFLDTEVRCLAFACPQVLDADLAASMREHTTSYVAGEDCVPCLSWATALDLRDALVIIADPEAQGLTPALRADEVLAAAERGEVDLLAAQYATVRHIVGSSKDRLYPSGCLIRLMPGSTPSCAPREARYGDVDEMVVTADMVMGHMPRRYLAAVQEVVGDGAPVAPLWSEPTTASGVRGLPKL